LIDNWKTRGLVGTELYDKIRTADDETFFGSEKVTTAVERDWISHHVLRLAYSRNQNLQTWFKQHETSLFE
jgi:DNA primase large subunit